MYIQQVQYTCTIYTYVRTYMTDIYNTYGVYSVYTDLHMIAQIQCACVYGRIGRYIYTLSFMHVLDIRIFSFDTLGPPPQTMAP